MLFVLLLGLAAALLRLCCVSAGFAVCFLHSSNYVKRGSIEFGQLVQPLLAAALVVVVIVVVVVVVEVIDARAASKKNRYFALV